jgi:histidinol dehydrogenase
MRTLISLLTVLASLYIANILKTNLQFQAEHGPDSQVVLVIAGDGVDQNAIQEELSKQCQSLPRGEFAAKALSHSFIVYARDMLEVSPFVKFLSVY